MLFLRFDVLHVKANTNNRHIGPSISSNLISWIFHVCVGGGREVWFLYLRQNMESQCIYCVLSTLCGLGRFTVYCSNTHDYYYDTIHMRFVGVLVSRRL